jgi:hypothetical protein
MLWYSNCTNRLFRCRPAKIDRLQPLLLGNLVVTSKLTRLSALNLSTPASRPPVQPLLTVT